MTLKLFKSWFFFFPFMEQKWKKNINFHAKLVLVSSTSSAHELPKNVRFASHSWVEQKEWACQ